MKLIYWPDLVVGSTGLREYRHLDPAVINYSLQRGHLSSLHQTILKVTHQSSAKICKTKAILTLVYRQSKMIKLEKKSEYLSCRKDLRVLCIILQILHIV